VRKIVSICPHCVRTIAEDWREYGAEVTIEHHSEFMARHQDKLPSSRDGERVVFHDPCYLGRYRGIYDQPREVIARSGTVVDPPRARERSFCCGAGGGLVFLGEETGQRVNETRVKELTATGAKTIGAACPFCNSMFRDALASTAAENPPRLMDIAQLAAESISRTQPPAEQRAGEKAPPAGVAVRVPELSGHDFRHLQVARDLHRDGQKEGNNK
jgi:Fe-S oxidoreductase